MIIKGIKEPIFGVYSYLVIENNHCILIDPILTKKLSRAVSNFLIDFAFVTHEHFDHIRSVNDFKIAYGNKIICGEKARFGMINPSKNMSRYLEFLSYAVPFGNHNIEFKEYTCEPDFVAVDNQTIIWQGHTLYVKETPGHSEGSICILIDNKHLFSGDVVFSQYPTATKMPGGSTKKYYSITDRWLSILPPNTMVYPGHTKPFKLSKRYR